MNGSGRNGQDPGRRTEDPTIVTQDFVLRVGCRVIRWLAVGLFAGPVGWVSCLHGNTAIRQLRRRSPRHEQEVKENVLARPAADARESSLSLSLCFSFPLLHQPLFLFRWPVRSLRHASRSLLPIPLSIALPILLSIPIYTHRIHPAFPILRPQVYTFASYTRLCNMRSTHPVCLYM